MIEGKRMTFSTKLASVVLITIAIVFLGWTITRSQDTSPKSEAPVLATVDGAAITMRDVELRWKAQDASGFASMEARQAEIVEKVLDDLIAEQLIGREAQRLGVSAEELLKSEVETRIQPISEDDVVEEFKRLSRGGSGPSYDVARSMILQYLTRRQPFDARAKYVGELWAKAGNRVEKKRGLFRRDLQVLSTDPVLGPATAPVTLVLFSDFQCPYCRQIEPVLARVRSRFAGQVKLVWKDFPKPDHDRARIAARAARCAHEQGRFFEYRDQIFKGQEKLSTTDLVQYAHNAGVQTTQFEACLESDRNDALVSANLELAAKYGVTGTPTMFVNGRVVIGAVGFDILERIIIDELASSDAARTTLLR